MSTDNANKLMQSPAENFIILRSVYGKVGMKYYIQPSKDPRTGRYPDCVKPVNSVGDMILSDPERNSGKIFIKETETFVIEDGTTFDLNNPYDAAKWEAIKNCIFIAQSRDSKDSKGVNLIDGPGVKGTLRPRQGIAEIYIERPGYEAAKRVSKKKKIHDAGTYILDDPRGDEGRVQMARLLGKHMRNVSSADVTDFLLSIAEKDPDRIINLYTGDDINIRLLFMDAKDKHVIIVKQKLYMYGDSVCLGATDDAAITWMKDPRNRKVLELIKKDTYPDLYEDFGEDETGEDTAQEFTALTAPKTLQNQRNKITK